MSPFLVIKPKDRSFEWLTFDFSDEPDIRAIVVLPAYGPDHRAGLDCWCGPECGEGGTLIVHRKPPH